MDQKLIQDDKDSYGSTDSMEEPPMNIDSIVKNIENIGTNCRFLKKASNTIGTTQDSVLFRHNIQSTLFSCKTLVDETNEEVTNLVRASLKKDLAKRLQVEKLRNHFKDAVLVFSNLQQVLLIKLKRNLPTEPCPISHSDHKTIDYVYDEEEQLASIQQQSFKQSLETQGEIIEREDAMHKIETNIIDINEMMRELSTLTVSQGHCVDSIENAVEMAYSDVEAGRTELEKAAEYMNKRRKNIVCLCLMLFIIVCTMAIMLYFTLKQN